jgi:hypothetical protein
MVLRHPEQHAEAINCTSVPILDEEAHVNHYLSFIRKLITPAKMHSTASIIHIAV